uniref:Uncharacterized protein n=1 Tax=Parastrongyloides trichosuri TaxID=131310 RepID=A0A0N4ZIV2_PARTI
MTPIGITKVFILIMIIFMSSSQTTVAAPNRVMMRFGKRFSSFENEHPYNLHPLLQFEGSPENIYRLTSYINRNQLYPMIPEIDM